MISTKIENKEDTSKFKARNEKIKDSYRGRWCDSLQKMCSVLTDGKEPKQNL